MICRRDRDEAARLLIAIQDRRFRRSDALLAERLHQSRDPTVRVALAILGEFTEDYPPNKVPFEKSEWDLLERVRLVLLSDCSLRETRLARSPRHSLLLFAASAATVGIGITCGPAWYVVSSVSLILPALAIWLHDVRVRRYGRHPFRDLIEPFTSLGQLENVYRSTPAFRKRVCPDTRDKSLLARLAGGLTLVMGSVASVALLPWIAVMVLLDHSPEYEVV